MLMRKLKYFVTVIVLATFVSSCAYMPLTRKWQKWAGEDAVGRKTFMERLGSLVVTILTSPVVVVTLIIDIPVAIIEFFFGKNLIDDPLLQSAGLDDFEERHFVGNDEGVIWKAKRMADNPEYVEFKRFEDGQLKKRFMVRKIGEELEVNELALQG